MDCAVVAVHFIFTFTEDRLRLGKIQAKLGFALRLHYLYRK